MTSTTSADLSGLARLARDHRLDLRSVALRVQTDLFVTAPARDPSAIKAFADLACGLLPSVDDDTAALVARKLAPVSEAPEEVLVELARRGGNARRAVVEMAPVLSDTVLQAAKADGVALEPMLAARPGLGSRTAAGLAERNDAAIDLVLAGNAFADLSGHALDALIARGREQPELARALLERSDLGALDRAPLYLAAGPEQRDRIRAEVEGVAALRRTTAPASRDPQGCERLVELAAERDVEAFEVRLAAMLNLTEAPEWTFTAGSRHDLLAFALLAVGMREEDAIRIFLTLSDPIAHSVAVVFRLVSILRSTSRAAAAHLLEAILELPLKRPSGRHIPLTDPGAESVRDDLPRRAEPVARPAVTRVRRTS